jgi:hypothetical protein
MCPPNHDDPRKYKAGKIVGTYADLMKARTAVEAYALAHHMPEANGCDWFRLDSAMDANTQFLGNVRELHNTYSGYVTKIVFERRTGERRK